MNTREFEILNKAKENGFEIYQKSVLVKKGRLRWEYFPQMKHNYEDVALNKPFMFNTVKQNYDETQTVYQAVDLTGNGSDWLKEKDLIDYLKKRLDEYTQDM